MRKQGEKRVGVQKRKVRKRERQELEARRVERREEEKEVLDALVRIRRNKETIKFE